MSTAAPVSPVQSPAKFSVDDFVNSALANAEPEPEVTPEPKQRRSSEREPPARRREPEPELEQDELDELEPEEIDEAPAEGDETDDEDEGAPDPRGSQEQPYKRADIPKDKYIELKVDGEKVVVKLSEALDSYVGQKTFHQRANRLHEQSESIKSLVEDALATKQGVHNEVRELFHNPEKLYGLMLDRFEPVLKAVATQYAIDSKKWREQPESRLEHDTRIQRARIENERAALQAQQEAAQRTQAEQRQIENDIRVFRPGWEEGQRLTGYPVIDEEFKESVNTLLMTKLRTTQRPLTSKDVADAVVRVAKVLGAQPTTGKKPKPAQVIPTKQARAAAPSGKSRKPADMGRPGARPADFFLPEKFR